MNFIIVRAGGGGSHEVVEMNNSSYNLAVKHLLLDELKLVQAAIERRASAEGALSASEEWSAKLQKWRTEIENSLRRLPDRAG